MKAKLLTLVFTLLGLSLTMSVAAQVPEIARNVVAGQQTSFGVISQPQAPRIRVAAKHGVATFQSSGTATGAIDTDVILYTSTSGYFGMDTFMLEYWSPTPFPRAYRVEYILKIAPSVVNAMDDFAATVSGQPVVLPVLANDTATFADLALSAISVVSNGTATIQGDDISFTPKPGFTGVATFQYVTCDLLGICDQATGLITVSSPTPQNDTLKLQVEKNAKQVVLLDPQNFPLTVSPQHGTLSTGYPLLYTPDLNYSGTDAFEWSYQIGSILYTKRVEVEVLNTFAANLYARDDQAFISKGTVAYINVLGNDLQGSSLSGFGIYSSPQNGSVAIRNNQIVYTPNPRFTGVDKFRYRVYPPLYSGPAEYATVTVLVSDLPPASFEFALETPKNTPLVVQYPIPLTNYSFGVLNPVPSYGQAIFLPTADTSIAGYPVDGERLLVYNPSPGFSGQDLVRVNYCITTTGVCVALNLRITVKDIPTPAGGWCIQNCVWPGDTDGNGKVDVADLLPIGRKHGMQGATRSAAGGSCQGSQASDWLEMDNLRDLKYVDANGDGIISASDTSVILSHIGRYHSPYPAPTAPVKPLPFVLSFPYDTIYAGDLYAIDISLGTQSFYAYNVYGFTLGFNFNPEFVVPGSQELIYDNDAWTGYGSAVIDIVHEPTFGFVQSAYTRTNARDLSGFGRVGRFYFIGGEDILGFRPEKPKSRIPNPNEETPAAEVVGVADFELTNGSVSIGGISYSVPGDALSIPVAVRPKSLGLRDQDLVVYPNPARLGARTRIHLNGADGMDEIRVLSELGVVVSRAKADSNDYSLSTEGLPAGVYTVEVEREGRVLRQRLVVQ